MQRAKRSPVGPPRATAERLPAVSRLLEARPVAALVRRLGHGLVRDLLRDQLAELRGRVRSRSLAAAELERAVRPQALAAEVARRAAALTSVGPRLVINATGVIVHTNLGRAVLSEAAAARVAATARSYVDLEYDLDLGRRGSRLDHLAPLVERLFPGAAFAAVNNNAAAILLVLRALAKGREVVVSRGELVEIGGSFRVPDILAASGARLREVGTTNRTRLADYERALSPRTGLLLKVHTSNFRIVGFTEETSVAQLAALARKSGVPLAVDWGSGDLVDLKPLGITDELPVRELLRAGADLVTFSCDKLLGGPQAGIVVGREDLILRLRRDPLARVCRLDRLLLAALAETLAAYARGAAFDEVPTLRMLAATAEDVGRRAARVRLAIARKSVRTGAIELIDGVSRTGGGSSPTGERPTRLVAIDPAPADAAELEQRLRAGKTPIVARIQDGRVLLDLRTVLPDQEDRLVEGVAAALGRTKEPAPRQTLKRNRITSPSRTR